MTINPNDAPEGYEAVAAGVCDCDCCAFFGAKCPRESCFPKLRTDGQSVIFIRRDTGPIMATANFPYDSEGTPVEVLHA